MSLTPGMFPSGAGSDRFSRIRTNNNNSIRGNSGAGITNNVSLNSGTNLNTNNARGGSSFNREEINTILQSNRGNDSGQNENNPITTTTITTTTNNINRDPSIDYTYIIIGCLLVVLLSVFIYKTYKKN